MFTLKLFGFFYGKTSTVGVTVIDSKSLSDTFSSFLSNILSKLSGIS